MLGPMVLPFLPAMLARTTCPHCKADEVVTRASLKVGARHRCPSCKAVYPVAELRSITSRAAKPAPKKR
jgi:transposase-like protein